MPRESIPSRTLGIDLASQPKDTGVCMIEWHEGAGEIVQLERVALTDDALVGLMKADGVTKVGIDAPFGWPLAFIDAISSYRDEGRWMRLEPNEMRFRATEILIYQETNQWPLSAAMDNLGWPAMRCARLLSRVVSRNDVLDRSGDGLAVEVYPMVALRRWGIIASGTSPSKWSYKEDKPGRRERRTEYLAALRTSLGDTLRMTPEQEQLCIDDDDDFDALISALVARAVEVQQADPVPQGMRWVALREGWIRLPTPNSLSQLAAA